MRDKSSKLKVATTKKRVYAKADFKLCFCGKWRDCNVFPMVIFFLYEMFKNIYIIGPISYMR